MTKEEIIEALKDFDFGPPPPKRMKPTRPKLETVEGGKPFRDEMRVGPTREVGKMLTSIDPGYRPAIVKVTVLERSERGSLVEFGYDPVRRFENETPSWSL